MGTYFAMIKHRTFEQKYYHEVCANYLSHSAILSIVSEKGSVTGSKVINRKGIFKSLNYGY